MNPITLSNLTFGIDETLLAVQDEVRKFCQKEVAPLAETTDKKTTSLSSCGKNSATWACWA